MAAVQTSSPESGFLPRKEFIKEQQHLPNFFALLTISGPNYVRLYSFSPALISSLRRLFDRHRITSATREDVSQNFYEFALEGKPWSSPKTIATERLLVQILTAIYRNGYSFVSSIDYGREHDDRLAIAFSKPAPSPSTSTEFASSTVSSPPVKRLPFALSFPSATLLRVISPPLDTTPAILQAVRGSWPRGVVSEKKVGDSSFEFKLKGYKWFQEDTFATDSLRHILSLLSSLDAHQFSLLASISLTNRSRVKDLWIFTGPAPSSEEGLFSESPAPSTLNLTSAHGDLHKASPPALPHRRLATEPARSPTPNSPLAAHHRLATEQGHQRSGSAGSSSSRLNASHVLRKPAPRAQVPESVHDNDDTKEYRVDLPSTISESVDNMTGVGAHHTSPQSLDTQTPDVFYATSPFAPPLGPAPAHIHQSPVEMPKPPPHIEAEPSSLQVSPEHSQESIPSPIPSPGHLVALDHTPSSSSGPGTPTTPREVMSPHMFTVRDSAFSTNTENTELDGDVEVPIPIKWTGVGSDPSEERIQVRERERERQQELTRPPRPERLSSTPNFPGGWQQTPVDEQRNPLVEKENEDEGEGKGEREREESVHDVTGRVASPMLNEPDRTLRQSEAGLIGVMTSVPESPEKQEPVQANVTKESSTQKQQSGDGKGWVLINVEGQASGSNVTSPTSPVAAAQSPPKSETTSQSPTPKPPPAQPESSMSPAAKAIAVIDAVDAKNKSKGKEESPGQSSSRIKRFFSLTRRDSDKVREELEDRKAKSSKAKGPGLGEKLKKIGTPEAARNDGARRSIDG